jgi:N-acetylglucosaminyldiphosphoundecaprenol N-acetyl-beta-D-mannosaminyltransferase
MNLEAAVDQLVAWAHADAGRTVHLCNGYTLSLTADDESYASVIDRGDLNLTDGMPLAWLAQRAGFDVDARQRPRGAEVFLRTIIAGQELGVRHYLYGGSPAVVDALARRLRVIAPKAHIVGVESPPFRALTESERQDMVERIRSTDANIVWVGLGTPKQDHFVDEYRDELGAILVAVGAAFDFLAGAKREAPGWIAQSGLEWAFRFASEPRRLWRRYLIGNTRFILGAMRTGIGTVE